MLTARQQELLDFLRDQQQQGVMPTSREVQRFFGYASQTAAMDLLRALEKKGAIRRLAGKARAVILVPGATAVASESSHAEAPVMKEIPIYGTIAAGMPEDSAEETLGTVHVDLASMEVPRSARAFALRVRGDSMIDAHILSGDLAVMELREPRAGDIVAAVIDGDCTLKRFLTKNGRPYLKAENRAYPDLIPAAELLVQGVMVGLIRPHLSRSA
jgi:repressor LexA